MQVIRETFILQWLITDSEANLVLSAEQINLFRTNVTYARRSAFLTLSNPTNTRQVCFVSLE